LKKTDHYNDDGLVDFMGVRFFVNHIDEKANVSKIEQTSVFCGKKE